MSFTSVIAFVRAVMVSAGWRFWNAVLLTVAQALIAALAIVVLIPLSQAAGLGAGTETTSWLFDASRRLFGSSPNIAVVLGAFVVLTALQGWLGWAHARLAVRITQDVVLDLRRRLFRAICGADWTVYARQSNARLLAGLTEQAQRAGYATYEGLSLAVGTITIVAYLALALAISVPLTIVVLASGGALTWALASRRRVATVQGSRLVEGQERLYRTASEALAGMKLIRSAGAEGRHIAEFDRAAGELREGYVSLSTSPSAVQWWFSLGTATILAVVAYVALQLFGMPGTELAVLLIVFWRLSPRLTALQVSYHTVLGGLPAYDAAVRLAAELTSSSARAVDVSTFEYRRSVDLVDLGFEYTRGTPVIADVTLSIPAGQTVAVVGPSGAGKSTLADLVLGLVPPSSGRIAVDGLALTPERMPAWSEQVAYVPQDPFLFHDTVRANLLWAAPAASETEMWTALQASAADFVTRLPAGLDTVVGDRGVLLSGGERQRLALARALLRQPRLLVLDEATSSLDAENEDLIRTAIDRLHGRTAILVISHRLSTVRNADVIHVLEHGRLVESGRWDELCLRPGGRFRALWKAQDTSDPAADAPASSAALS